VDEAWLGGADAGAEAGWLGACVDPLAPSEPTLQPDSTVADATTKRMRGRRDMLMPEVHSSRVMAT